MSKPEIFTTAHVMDKEFFTRYGEDLSRHIAEQFGRRLAEKIYQECQKGERIVSVGKPYSQDILETNQIETRMNVRVQELVRCKDCKSGRPWTYMNTKEYVTCEVDCEPIDRDSNFFCADGERRSE